MLTVLGLSEVFSLRDLVGQVFNHCVLVVDDLLVDLHLLIELGKLRFKVLKLFQLLLGRLSLAPEQPAIHSVEQALPNLSAPLRVQFSLQRVDLLGEHLCLHDGLFMLYPELDRLLVLGRQFVHHLVKLLFQLFVVFLQ